MLQTLKDRIRTSMGLKFAITLSGWISVLMLVGTIFVARMFLDYQYRALEDRGHTGFREDAGDNAVRAVGQGRTGQSE